MLIWCYLYYWDTDINQMYATTSQQITLYHLGFTFSSKTEINP